MVSWSPALDDIGNSYRGVEFCKAIGETFNFHIFDNHEHTNKINPLNETYDTNSIKLNNELCFAAYNGDLEHIKILFNRNVDFNTSDYDGRTALHLAVCEKHSNLIRFLLNVVKVNINKKDRWGKVAKDEATDPEILELFK
jgi:glutaminase